jgi:hypothetical protein
MCGNGLPAGASFCSSCGAAVVAATTPPVDAGDVGKQPEPPIHESPIPSTRAVRADSAVAESISLRALAIAWWRRRGGWAKTGLILGAIVLLLAPLSALGSSGGPPSGVPLVSPPAACCSAPPRPPILSRPRRSLPLSALKRMTQGAEANGPVHRRRCAPNTPPGDRPAPPGPARLVRQLGGGEDGVREGDPRRSARSDR